MKHISNVTKNFSKALHARVHKGIRYIILHKEGLLYYSVAALVICALSLSAQRYREQSLHPNAESHIHTAEIPTINVQPLATSEPTAAEKEKTWIMPVSGEICREYSAELLVWSDSMEQWQLHSAVDIKAASSEAVRAAADGVIADIYSHSLFGNIIEIDHGDGCVIRYCSLSTTQMVQVGNKVAQGDIISGAGTCSAETELGPHVHLKCTINGEPVDFMTLAAKREDSDLHD